MDGWTDLEEARLGIDPIDRDTDRDGIPDGMDPCPNYAAPKGMGESEEIRILQKAVFATFGLTDSRHMLTVGKKSIKMHVWGYGGPVIYEENQRKRIKIDQFGSACGNWKILKNDGLEARVEIRDSIAVDAASGREVLLKKINDKWYVISVELTWVT